MRALVISAAFPPMPAGEATNAYYLCEHLAERNLEVHVLTSYAHGVASDPRFTVHPLMRNWSWAESPRLATFMKRCSPDVVYLMYLGWTYDHQFMMTFAPTIARYVLPRAPFVTRFENVGGAGPQTNSLLSRAIRKSVARWDPRGSVDYEFGTLLRDSDAIVLLSGRHQEVLERHLPGVGGKCVVIPPPSNMRMSADNGDGTREQGRKRLGAEPGDFLLAYIGFVYPGKGIETLLHALKQVSAERRHVRLAVIGGSLAKVYPDHPRYVDEMRDLARDLGIDQKVIWTGEYSWDSDEASVYLRAADACVLPFDTGVKLNNSSFSSAAAHGLPIITTKDDLLEEQFLHGENVFLCPPQSPDAVALAIKTLMDDVSLRSHLSAGSLRLAQEWYGWKAAVDKTLSLFAKLLPCPKGGERRSVGRDVARKPADTRS
jgi:glycosyltransferase involved in cell wall biosynthesis